VSNKPNLRVVVIAQARMMSERLPGKALMSVNGKPLLGYLIDRINKAKFCHELWIATTTNKPDDHIIEYCNKRNIQTFRGSENDVLDRYYGAAIASKADVIVRITADCPLIDPLIVDLIVGYYLDNALKYDYVSNVLERTFPRGMDVEVFSLECLQRAHKEATSNWDKEHVTPYIYSNPEKFRLKNIKNSSDESHHRWTVDTKEDFFLVRNILEVSSCKKEHLVLNEILMLMKRNPDWTKINNDIGQKVKKKY